MEQDEPISTVRSMNSVLSTLRVLEEVAARQPVGVSALSRLTQIPKSSVQRCLLTLQEAGWLRVVDSEHARWGLTMKALVVGLRGAGEQDLRALASPVVKRLAAETDETAFFGLYDGDQYVIVEREDSTRMLRASIDIGTRLLLTATSAGVAILARLPAAAVERIRQRELQDFPEIPVPSADDLQKEIGRTVKRGCALNVSSWYDPHVASIGAAVSDPAGRPIAGLTLSIPTVRFDRARERQLTPLVVSAANEVSSLISNA